MVLFRRISIAFLLVFTCLDSIAQFAVTGEYINRSEYQNGYNGLISQEEDALIFTNHRFRINTLYEMDKITISGSLQDVRRWGDTKTMKEGDDMLSVYEAWAQYAVSDFLKLKVGRQELNYDNQRLLGNNDWVMQARSFDALVLKFDKDNLSVHGGGGFYQPSDQNQTGLTFLKSMQYAYGSWNNEAFKASVLFLNNGLQSYTNANRIFLTDVFYRQTVGVPEISYTMGSWKVLGFGYFQFGKDVIGDRVEAYDVSMEISKKFSTGEISSLLVTLGSEYMTGTDQGSIEGVNRSFTPLFGSNHNFNGYMDYFFEGGKHENDVGLWDSFIRVKQQFGPSLFLSVNVHSFSATADIIDQDALLGNEIDAVFGWKVGSGLSLQAGYSQFIYTRGFRELRQRYFAKDVQNWAYVSLIFRPFSEHKFIGLRD